MKTAVIILGIIIAVLLGVLVFVNPAKGPTTSGTATSTLPDTGAVQTAQSADGHVRVSVPYINEAVASPVTIVGTVIGGGWFFEASFPVKVLDGDGTVIGQGHADAQGDWMVATPVAFSATIAFTKPKHTIGTVLLEKDNPSGLPQNAGELRIPVKFQ